LTYWLPKLARTRKRDEEHLEALANLGWTTHVVWECELQKAPGAVLEDVKGFLGPKRWPQAFPARSCVTSASISCVSRNSRRR
jgi:hypothetical protein